MTTVSLTVPVPPKTATVLRVLVCADHRDNRVTLGILLRSEGYIVQLARDAAEGLRIGTAYRPDVAFLDFDMPGRSAFSVAHEFQRHYGNDCPFLIAMAPNGDSENLSLAEISGFNHFLGRPYAPQEVLEVLASLDR